jgi:hypothetical protein
MSWESWKMEKIVGRRLAIFEHHEDEVKFGDKEESSLETRKSQVWRQGRVKFT